MNDDARRRRILRDFRQLHFEVNELARTTAEALGLLRYTTQKVETLMAYLADLNAKIAELEQSVKDDEAQDDANETALKTVIEDLKAQLAAANVDLQPQIDALEAIRGNLHAPA